MNNTEIEWCDATWNPVTGCQHGCKYCYARKMANRFKGFIPFDSDGASGVYYHEPNSPIYEVYEPLKIRHCGKISKAPYPFNFEPTLRRDNLGVPQRWKKPRTIFVCSMADLFGDWVPDEWIEQVFTACEKAPQHRYLFLTKNPKRYIELARKGRLPEAENFWYGSSSTAQDSPCFYSDKRNTFISAEPLLEDVAASKSNIDTRWIIIGAETGNRKDKIVPKKEWIDNICAVADKQNIPVFMKDSLIPIVGEHYMRREFPWERGTK
ncbi:MAG: DUF5131 family protein [Oscillospiraceae bacterium]|nr:DUF5131 family protein [Oscillospiraceae bacterium]